MENLIALLVAAPLLGAAVLLCGGRRLDAVGHWIGTALAAVSFVLGVVLFADLLGRGAEHRTLTQHLFSWVPVEGFQADVAFRVDQLSMTFVLLITGVGSLIHLYSVGYMEHDERRRRFFGYLNLFLAAMLLLVLADNYLLLYVGWEGVGLASYLLIGFWQHKPSAATAAKKAFLVNRVGDMGLSIAIMLMFTTFGTFAFGPVLGTLEEPGLVGGASEATLTGIALMLLLAACGKSAQVPLQSWLGDAMEGPTPVSALIHAATMVTAGVYLIVRSGAIFNAAPDAQLVVTIVGAVTLLFGAIVGCAKDDIKKALAGSTMSQIGYMVLAAGLGPIGYVFAIMHLVTHGFFKAGLFLGAGSVMHGMNDEVDMRKYGGLRKYMPVTFVTFGLGYLAIIGFPGLSGFFSKDKIIEAAFAKGGTEGWILGGCALLGAAITAYYMTRVMLMTFFGEKRWQPDAEGHEPHPHESPKSMTIPMIVLAFGSVFAGGLFSIGDRFLHWLEPVTGHAHGHSPVSALTVTLATMVVLVIGVAIAYGPVRPPPGPGRRPARVAAHPGRPPRPAPGRLQPRGPGPWRRAPHAVPGLRRPHPGRRRRQRHGGLGRRPLRADAQAAERLRAVVRGLDVRRRGGPRRRDPADEGGLIPMSFPLLTATAALPALGAIATAAVPAARRTAAKWLALLVSLATLVLAIVVLVRFDPDGDRYQLTESHAWIADFGVRYELGVDGIGVALIALTALLIPFIILAGWHDADPLETGNNRWRPTQGFFALILAVEAMVIISFEATDVFLFYIFFEAMLIPMYFLIGGFGDRAHASTDEKAAATQRSYAAVKFLLYNLVGGLIMLAAVIGLYVVAGNFSLQEIAEARANGSLDMATNTERWLFLGFFFAFAVKAPLWPLHTWLPNAMGEATTPVAVLITAVVDKVGTFAMLRFCLQLFPEASKWATPAILVLALISIIYGALLAVGQRDIKRLVAYASISHFGFIIMGIFAMTSQGQSGRDALHGQPRHLDRRADAGGRLPDLAARLAAHRRLRRGAEGRPGTRRHLPDRRPGDPVAAGARTLRQ